MSAARDYQLGLLFVTLSAITWSTAGFFTRLIGLDYATMIAGRGIFGALGIFIVILATHRRNWMTPFATMGRIGLLYVAIVVVGMIAFVGSLGLTSVAHSAVIFATIPFISALLGWIFLRERPAFEAVAASLVALVGVGIMVGFGADGGIIGDFLSLLATVCMALSIIIIRGHTQVSITACACLGSLMSGLVCLPFASLSTIGAGDIGLLAMFGLMNSAAGLTLFSLGSRRLPAIETALISTLDTPLAPLWVWLAFNETAGLQTLVGGVIVLLAVIGHILMSQRRQRA
ncbi:DMT family transporter [Rhizobium alvei]|uniref:DMT family transporter n=1 Tax=Rhizobium alvei TaxID=1132659 RepID=A0ABT8YJ48_9HYPH|nr:DMT family transporter [Rhizobium alvei]MDO6963309.1 DMT family transporter [Rhizobium alvei]